MARGRRYDTVIAWATLAEDGKAKIGIVADKFDEIKCGFANAWKGSDMSLVVEWCRLGANYTWQAFAQLEEQSKGKGKGKVGDEKGEQHGGGPSL
mmetsp:Transcript_4394/g.4955  ORF Transcript_4394/g.4955 Transcript_4394/m.4955 type:complete len:95 (-) Transcript_4394:38-322(-)